MKYLLFESTSTIYPIVFPEFIGHHDIKKGVLNEHPDNELISGGFCDADGNVWGESVSCQIKSHTEDVYFLKKLFGKIFI